MLLNPEEGNKPALFTWAASVSSDRRACFVHIGTAEMNQFDAMYHSHRLSPVSNIEHYSRGTLTSAAYIEADGMVIVVT